jgi:murein DD-endopeptidase MepM/ murein hydrolase activator NlpD
MGRITRAALGLALAGLVALAVGGCSSTPKPGRGAGTWYVVQPGDTLWRVSQRFGVPVDTVKRANQLGDARTLAIGQRLWVPRVDVGSPPPPARAALAASHGPHTLEQRETPDCGDAAREASLAFEWPVLGTTTSGFDAERGDHRHDGIDIGAALGAPVHAAEAGKVVYAGDDLGAYGRAIVIKHVGSWATVYAHNDRNLVGEGDFVEKGDVIARVGQSGNASAPHLHFEIRRANVPRDPKRCLP